MVVSEQLKKQIVIEILALIFLILVIIYAVFAIQKGNQNKVSSFEGMVIVVDDKNNKKLEKHSDGEGLENDGITYTVTNNNDGVSNYDLVIIPNVHDEDVLNQIRISVDDLYVSTLTELTRYESGYVLTNYQLKPGYTKIHLIKMWYKLSTNDDIVNKDISFEYRLVKR